MDSGTGVNLPAAALRCSSRCKSRFRPAAQRVSMSEHSLNNLISICENDRICGVAEVEIGARRGSVNAFTLAQWGQIKRFIPLHVNLRAKRARFCVSPGMRFITT